MKSPVALTAAPGNKAHSRCQFSFSDGRQCHMPRWSKHRVFCLPHAREEQRLLALDRLGPELASVSGEFKTVSDVNHVLGNVFTLFANNRLARRDAVAFAYIGQLLLQSLPGVKREIREHFGDDAWDRTLEAALAPPDPESSAAEEIPTSAESQTQNEGAPQTAEAQNEFDGMAALREVFSEMELAAAGCPAADQSPTNHRS